MNKILCTSRHQALTGKIIGFQLLNKCINNRGASGSSKSNSSSSSSSSEDEQQLKEKNKKALNKLNDLLQQMVEEKVIETDTKLNLAKPKGRFAGKMDQKEQVESRKVESNAKQVANLVQDVAKSLHGDTKQIESELLLKLLNTTRTDNETNISSLSDIVKGMKIDRQSKVSSEQSRAQQVRQILENVKSDVPRLSRTQRKPRPRVPPGKDLTIEKIDLFNSEPLGIFTKEDMNYKETILNQTWNNLHQKELKLAVIHPPNNYFQQMILWTEQGKVWKFPIDNEQGMEQEQNVYFAEHVFLEKHLEPWCPPKGPLRHFMELVCVGLSKNPYLTVEAKGEHINWFKDYFEDKKQLLKEVGALDSLIETKPKVLR